MLNINKSITDNITSMAWFSIRGIVKLIRKKFMKHQNDRKMCSVNEKNIQISFD